MSVSKTHKNTITTRQDQITMADWRCQEEKTLDTAFEKHFTISDLKELWGLGRETVRKLFMHEPGVIHVRLGAKKSNSTYSIPESVARRVHNRLQFAI